MSYALQGLGATGVTGCGGGQINADESVCCKPTSWSAGTFQQVLGKANYQWWAEIGVRALLKLLLTGRDESGPATFAWDEAGLPASAGAGLTAKLQKALHTLESYFPVDAFPAVPGAGVPAAWRWIVMKGAIDFNETRAPDPTGCALPDQYKYNPAWGGKNSAGRRALASAAGFSDLSKWLSAVESVLRQFLSLPPPPYYKLPFNPVETVTGYTLLAESPPAAPATSEAKSKLFERMFTISQGQVAPSNAWLAKLLELLAPQQQIHFRPPSKIRPGLEVTGVATRKPVKRSEPTSPVVLATAGVGAAALIWFLL